MLSNQTKEIELEATSKSTKPSIRTTTSQISNNNNLNINSSANQQLINSMRSLNNINNSSLTSSNAKGIYLNVYNSNPSGSKLSFGLNKSNLTSNSNIFKSKI